jgi:hypothetical protein
MHAMFGSDILDIVIGMVFIFLLLSLVCSALKEFLEALVKNRARDLERGIRELIGDPQNTTNFVEKIYNHGLVNSLFKGCYTPGKKGNLPSYIPSANFALAVIDLVKNPPPTGIKLPDNVKKAYAVYAAQAAGDEAKLQAGLEDWFNSGMDRVSGWYKRRAQWILVGLGLVIAIALNADAVLIASRLSNDASLRKGLVALAQAHANQSGNQPANQPSSQPSNQPSNQAPGAAPAMAPATAPQATTVALNADPAPSPAASADQVREEVSQLGSIGLPIGWQSKRTAGVSTEGRLKGALHATLDAIKEHSVGWLLTAIAISMGAPFWFNLLNTIVRSTTKPDAAKS